MMSLSFPPRCVSSLDFIGVAGIDRTAQNAFSAFASQLTRFHFDIFEMLVVDIMHEFELGVWKAVLIHLIRILHSLGQDKVDIFNERYAHRL